MITPIYRDEQSSDLNKRLEEVLSNLETENEAINERLADLTIDPTERKVKPDAEITPIEQSEIAILREHQMVLERVIDDLKGVLYSGYTETPVNMPSHQHQKRYMKKSEVPLYLGKNVKPFILDGVLNQQEIADKLGVPSSTLSYWVQKAYKMDWKDYVDTIIRGIF